MRISFLTLICFFLLLAGGIFVWDAYMSEVTSSENVIADNIQTKPDTENTSSSAPPVPIDLHPREISIATSSSSLELPQSFTITVAAEELGKARFMSMSPDGRMFVPNLVDYNLSHGGEVHILEDFNEDTGQFETKHTYLSDLRGVNSIAFYEDMDGEHWIYVALTAKLLRFPYEAGDTEPSGEPEVVTTFPNKQVPGQSSVVWHITRTIAFKNDMLYVSVGSGCNACEDPEDLWRGMLYRMDPDGGNRELVADGLRNSVGFTWAEDTLYATANGADHLGVNAPYEGLYKIKQGEYYGWPYCYRDEENVVADTSQEWERDFSCENAPKPFTVFEPHSAPLGLAYFDGSAHPTLRNSFLVALHGSFEPEVRAGYKIVRVKKDGTHEPFIDGFQNEDGERFGRPVDILQHDKNSFFFTDDMGGRVYFVEDESL